MNTCAQVQHIEVGREVVSGISSGEMVQIGLMEKLPTIPNKGVIFIKILLSMINISHVDPEDFTSNKDQMTTSLHVVEEHCEHKEHSSRYTSKQEQLFVEEAPSKSSQAPPLRRLRATLGCILRSPQR